MLTNIDLTTIKFKDLMASGVDNQFILGNIDDKKLKAYVEIKQYYLEDADYSKYKQYVFEANIMRSPASDSSVIILCLDKDDMYEKISKLPFNILGEDPVEITIYIVYDMCCIGKICDKGITACEFILFDGEPDFVTIRIILDGYTISFERDNNPRKDFSSMFSKPMLVFDKQKGRSKNPIKTIVDYGPDCISINNDDNMILVPMLIQKPDSRYKDSSRYAATITYNSEYNRIKTKITLRRKNVSPDSELELVFDTEQDAIDMICDFGLRNVYYNGKVYKRSYMTKEGFNNVYRPDKKHD